VRSWDAILVGGGIIGLSLAISLRKQGLRVLIVERRELGREASHAAAGMLAASGLEVPLALRPLADASAWLYPEFVHELQDESAIEVDLREQGTILLSEDGGFPESAERLTSEQLESIEPALNIARGSGAGSPPYDSKGLQAAFLSEHSVDPRALVAAAIKACKHRSVGISSGSEVKNITVENDRAAGVQTDKTSYSAPIVVNCAGAWAGCVGPERFPVKPVKGQMLAVVGGPRLNHVVRSERVYLVPRSDGRIVIGSTLEGAGYDKRTDVDTIQSLFQAAVELVPALEKAKKHEDWAGLRPGTPDGLPILGETSVKGLFAATGHYRDGILLAPITAQVLTSLILQQPSSHDLTVFSPFRFVKAIHTTETQGHREELKH
jgi:glycine oxidase